MLLMTPLHYECFAGSVYCKQQLYSCNQTGHQVVSWPLQETELLAAGFPCIDVSRAGLRAGLQGKVRSTSPTGTHHHKTIRLGILVLY